VSEGYSAGRFLSEAAAALETARNQRRIAIFTGGTGLYFNVLTRGLSPIPAVPAWIRTQVRQRFASLGRERFYDDLVRRDPHSSTLRPSDTVRILRAAEVLEATGRALSEWQSAAGTPVLRGVRHSGFVLAPDRETIRKAVDRRFLAMIETGAIDETRALLDVSPMLPASRILGLRELSRFLRGEVALTEAVRIAQMETRRFAKRQLTWFRRYMADWTWLASAETGKVLSSIRGEQ
jgi:tRNA dimethylallyltransferase